MSEQKKWTNYLIQEDIFFRGSQLCIPSESMRDNIIKDKYNRGFARYFRIEKIMKCTSDSYCWPQTYNDVQVFF